MKKTIVLIIIITVLFISSCQFKIVNSVLDIPAYDDIDSVVPMETVLLKIAHDAAPEHSLNISLLEMEQWLEEKSEGRIEVEIYPFFELGDDPDLVALTAKGVIQMTLPQTSSLAILSTNDEDYPFLAPFSFQIWSSLDGFYLFDNEEAAMLAMDGELGAKMAATIADIPLNPLLFMGYAYDGKLCIASAKEDMRIPADIKEQKMGLIGTNEWESVYQKMGAYPRDLPLSEIYPALLREKISIYQTTPEHIATMYLDDYSRGLTLTEHGYAFRPMLVNRDWYESLSAENGEMIMTAINNFFPGQRQAAINEYQISLEILKNRGMKIIELSEEDKRLWQQ